MSVPCHLICDEDNLALLFSWSLHFKSKSNPAGLVDATSYIELEQVSEVFIPLLYLTAFNMAI